MEEIGRLLSEAREQLGLTLEEVERATRIRVHLLESIERGDLDALPSPVQARGFLHNYAEFLGLDPDTILIRYAENLQSRRSRRWQSKALQEPGTIPSVQIRSRRPRWLSSDLLVAATITLGVLAMLIWGGSRVMALLRPSSETTQGASGFIISSSTPMPTETLQQAALSPASNQIVPQEETQIPTQPLVFGFADSVNLRIVAEGRAWLSVVVDGSETFRGRVKKGEVLDFQAEEVVELVTGNGAGLRIIYNGQDQGLLGEVGQVIIRLWTLDGVITPTATVTRTATVTPRTTATSIPTPVLPSNQGG